jgi:hypothetical protein
MASLMDSTRQSLSAADRDHWVILTSSGARVHLAIELRTILVFRRRLPGEAPNGSSDKRCTVAGFQTLHVGEGGQFETGGWGRPIRTAPLPESPRRTLRD